MSVVPEAPAWAVQAAELVRLTASDGPTVPDSRHRPDTDAIDRLTAHPDWVTCVRNRNDRAACLVSLLADLDDRELFQLFAYHPRTVIREVLPALRGHQAWLLGVDLYEAWWQLASTGRLKTVAPRGQRTGAAYLARTRWVLYSIPFRDPVGCGLARDQRPKTPTLVTRARQAREDWLDVLDSIDDYPLYQSRIVPEVEAAALLDVPITIDRLEAGVSSGHNSVDAAVWRHCVRALLLPRFGVGAAWRLAWRLSRRAQRVGTIVAGVAFVAALLLLAVGVSRWWPGASGGLVTAATVAAGFGYATVVAVAVREPAAAWPWLLRQPASAMLGVVALVALHPDWWSGLSASRALGGAVVLAGLATGYLTIEAVNHGVQAGWPLLRRVGTVSAFGAGHATLISAAALRWLSPALSEAAEGTGRLHCLWSAAGCAPGTVAPAYVFGLAAAWCYAAGVFSQILWDDQPVTAPLTHLRWTARR